MEHLSGYNTDEVITVYYNSFSEAMTRRFGRKVYKLSLDGGFTCPNRDGKIGFGGCVFCSGSGSGDFAECGCGDISAQLERAKQRVAAKNRGGAYIAYFQSYTNTYAPVRRLEEVFYPAITHPDVVGLAVATRPDCLEPEKLRLLESLNRIKPVWVELGLQTVNPKTAAYIRRGYELPVYDDAMARLKAAGLETVVHMILGLPGETEVDMYRTAEYIGKSGADGIKLQLLHVLRGTDLYKDFMAGKFSVLEMEEYIRLLMGCIRRLPRSMVIHRMTGDGAKRDLAAPLWSGDKKRVLNAIRAAFEAEDLEQGSLWNE